MSTRLMKPSSKDLQSECPIRNEAFETFFAQAVDAGFMRVLGESGTQATYQRLEAKFGLPTQQIPRAINQFTKAIEELFGLGAKLLEIRIMEYLAKNTTTSWVFALETHEFSFLKYVTMLQAHLN